LKNDDRMDNIERGGKKRGRKRAEKKNGNK
jgi:hypothetical protein